VPAYGCGLDALPGESLRRPAGKKIREAAEESRPGKKKSWSLKKTFFGKVFLFENAE
jgi:hypothetical protein